MNKAKLQKTRQSKLYSNPRRMFLAIKAQFKKEGLPYWCAWNYFCEQGRYVGGNKPYKILI